MTTPEIPMDALRTVCWGADTQVRDAVEQLRAYVRAVDAERDARRDEELAKVLHDAYSRCNQRALAWSGLADSVHMEYRQMARAARAHIEGEARR